MSGFVRIERKSRRWEQVWQGESEAVASIVAGRLEAEGIQTRVHGHSAPYRAAAWSLGGAWGITVPSGKAAHARAVLRENDEERNVIEDETGAGLTSNQKLTIQVTLLAALAIAAVVVVLTVVN